MTLEYWREYRTHFHIGLSWGLSESNAFRNIRKVENILIKSGLFINDLFDEIAAQAKACNSTCTVYLQNLIDRALRSNTPSTPITRSNIDLDTYRTYLLWHQEFRKQGNYLNRLTKAIHAANLDDRMVDPTNCLRVLSSIAQANQEIAAAITKLEPKS